MRRLTVIAAAMMLTSPIAFANDKQLCETHLDDLRGQDVQKLREPSRSQVENHIELAKQAKKEGDSKNCIIHASKALQELEAPGYPHTSDRPPKNSNQ